MTGQRRFTGGDVLMRQLGVNPPIQLLWRLSGPLDRDVVNRVHARLARGPLNRRMANRRLPLARPVWAEHRGTRPPRFADRTLSPTDVLDWADEGCRTELDAHEGFGWELSAADVADGTSVVSLVGSHALTDGQGLLASVTLAARGIVPERSPQRSSYLGDLADLLSEGGRTQARLTAAQLRDRFSDPVAAVRGLVTRRRPIAAGEPPVRSRLMVSVMAKDLARVAEAEGGSTTGLLLAMTANILRAARGAAEGPFSLALPVSLREPEDLESSNMVGMAMVVLPSQRGRYRALADIKRLCRAAYGAVGPDEHLTGYPTTDAALSNGGEVPAETACAFGPSLGVLVRTVSGGGGAPGRMNCFSLQSGETLSLAFQSSGVAVDRELVETELDSWGVVAAHWW